MTDEIPKTPTPDAVRPTDADQAGADWIETPIDDEPGAPEVVLETPLEAEVADLKDKLLRTLAEMENLRKRTIREVDDARKYAVTSFARELLDVADNLKRALGSVPAEARAGNELITSLVAGIEMTERTLNTAFDHHHIERVEPSRGERFDHKLHQAMFELETADLPPGSIADVMQIGYVLADRLLRPAMVAVARAPSQAAPTTGEGGDATPGDRIDTVA